LFLETGKNVKKAFGLKKLAFKGNNALSRCVILTGLNVLEKAETPMEMTNVLGDLQHHGKTIP